MSTPSAAYMREWRQRNPDSYSRTKARQAALERARTQLSKRHPVELRELLAEELRKAGVAE